MLPQLPIQRHSRVNLASSKALPMKLQNKDILPSLSFTKPASMPASPTSTLTTRYQETLSTQTLEVHSPIVVTHTDIVSIESGARHGYVPHVRVIEKGEQLHEESEILDATRIYPVPDDHEKTVDYGTLRELEGDTHQMDTVTLNMTDIVRTPLITDDTYPRKTLEVFSTDVVVFGPSSTSSEHRLIQFLQELSKREDIPLPLRTQIESEILRVCPAMHAKVSSAFAVFRAVCALVHLQRRTKRRYQAQRDELINALGL